MKRETREVIKLEGEDCWVLAEWEQIKPTGKLIDVEGRAIFFNKDFHTMYVGYMHDGFKQGWGIEIPLKNREYRLPFAGMFHESKKVFPDKEQ